MTNTEETMQPHWMTNLLKGVFAAGLVACLALSTSAAQAKYPEKPITMIVPFGSGGSFDKLARSMLDALQKELGVTVVIKNNPGAGGRRGSVALFKSKPDGYTIGWLHFPPFLSDEIFFDRKPPVDYRKIEVIAMVAQGKDLIFLPKSSPYKSFEDLKNAKQPVRFTSTGVGAMSWVSISALAAAVGFDAKFVFGYKSTPRAALGAARGDADAGIGGYRQISGLLDEVTPILIFNDERSPHFPNVPSIKELGYPQLAGLGSPYVISAPPGTPKDIQAILRKAVMKVAGSDAYKKWASGAGFLPTNNDPAKTWSVVNNLAKIFEGLAPNVKAAKEKSEKK